VEVAARHGELELVVMVVQVVVLLQATLVVKELLVKVMTAVMAAAMV
jgi:hypothetical protein